MRTIVENLNIYKEFTTNLTNKIGTGDQGLGTRVFVWERCVKLSSVIIVDNPHSPFPIPHSLQWFVVKLLKIQLNFYLPAAASSSTRIESSVSLSKYLAFSISGIKLAAFPTLKL